jgi:arginine deiminase
MSRNDDLTLIDLTSAKQRNFDYIFDLFKFIKIELEPIYCGGEGNLIMAKREQWGQGANAFNLAPGIIIVYSRNILTINELSKKGYFCISAREFLKKSFTIVNAKIAILMDGEELSRARGGPRCLTHPIVREVD